VVTYILNELDTNHKESKLSFINKQSDSGETALMEATCSIGRRSCDTVQKIQDSFKTQLLLLENGANPSIVSNEEHPESFLQNFISAHYGNKHISSRLEKKGISSDLKEYLDSGSFDAGFKEVLAKAIEKGLDINVKSGMHNTPIVQALQYCNIPLFKTLKELGAVKPGAEDGLTYTPNCDDSNNVAKMQCFIDNYDAIENCEDSVKPAAEQAPVQDEL
jgi:ankyrin repeat protein